MDREQASHIRVTACFKLLKFWAGMRFNDAAHIKGSNLRFYDGKLSGVLVRTKTTGAGKRVRELPVFVGADAYIRHPGWLQVGLAVADEEVNRKREYLFLEGLLTGRVVGTSPMTYPEAVAASSEMMEKSRAGGPVSGPSTVRGLRW